MSLSPDTSAPPFPLTAGFTADWQTQASQRLVIKLSLSPGSYQISLLPDLMVLTSAGWTPTPDDVTMYTEEVLISSATIYREVNWWDSSGVFHPGENAVAQLQSSPDTLAMQAMQNAGYVSDVGQFEYYTATATIEPARTVTYPSGARDSYTSNYYLVVYGWNLSYPLQPDQVNVPMDGRFLVTIGNPTGQRTDAWGGEWLNVQSLFGTYQPPTVPPLVPPAQGDLDPQQLPPEITWSTAPDGKGIESPHIEDSATSSWWDQFGETVLSGYVSQALGALKPLADAYGYFNLGAALDVVNAANTALDVKKFLNDVVARIWAHDVQGMQLVLNPGTTQAQAAAWGAETTQIHQEIQEGSTDQVISSVLDRPLPGGGMLYSVWKSLNQKVSQQESFSLGLVVPGAPAAGGEKTDVISGGNEADTVQAGGGNDAVMAFEGNDVISAGDGRDWIWAGAGNDQVDGGAGVDTAFMSGGRSGYSITRTDSGATVASPLEGTDTLTNVERLMFADTGWALDIAAAGGQAYRLYRAAFDRAPDAGGVGYWINTLDHGVSLTAVAQTFMDSPEFTSKYGALSNDQFVNQLYLNVLDRDADAGGQAYWSGHLNARDLTRADVLMFFSESQENQDGVIGLIGNGFAFTAYG